MVNEANFDLECNGRSGQSSQPYAVETVDTRFSMLVALLALLSGRGNLISRLGLCQYIIAVSLRSLSQ